MNASNKKQIIDSQCIVKKYMDYVVSYYGYPRSVYQFCKESKIREEDFYQFFGSLDSVNRCIWNTFFSTTIDAIHRNDEYGKLSNKDKMLTFFYTFFELLALHKTYVLLVLRQDKIPLKGLGQLTRVRNYIKQFAEELIEMGDDTLSKMTISPVQMYLEGTWLHFLFLLKFWMQDQSAGFEKTDIEIEKSVNIIFDLLESTSSTHVFDFEGFLWRDKSLWN